MLNSVVCKKIYITSGPGFKNQRFTKQFLCLQTSISKGQNRVFEKLQKVVIFGQICFFTTHFEKIFFSLNCSSFGL